MIAAIMQPYFFPYIGYWQLIHAVDRFVLLDDVQYIRHGWINRNRILKPGGGWQYIVVPLKKHHVTELIKNVQVDTNNEWKELIIRQLTHYNKIASFFDETIEIVKTALFKKDHKDIASLNFAIIKTICDFLNIKTEVIISSEHNFNYEEIHDAGDWAFRISEQMGVTEYINPIGGANLFRTDLFTSSSIKLSFLKSNEITYPQGRVSEPSLSIIDVLMFNGIDGTKEFLKKYLIETNNKQVGLGDS